MEFFLRQVYPWLIEASAVSVLVPFFVAIYLFKKKHQNLLFKLLFAYVVFGVLMELMGKLTILMRTDNNLWLHHLGAPIEFCLLAAIFYQFFTSTTIKKLILASVGIVLILSLLDAFVLQSVQEMNSMPRIVVITFIIAMIIGYFYKTANDKVTVYLDRDPIFLLSCGILIFYAGTSMTWAMFETALEASYDAARICITIALVLNILLHFWLVIVFRRMAA